MAFTERLAILIDAKTGGAVREFNKVGAAADDLGDRSTRTGRALDRLGLSGKVSGTALQAGLGVAAFEVGRGLLALGANAIEAASGLQEQATAYEVVFGNAAEQVREFAEGADDAAGISERAAIAAANAFGNMLTQSGLASDSAAQFSNVLTQLGGDLASLRDTSVDQALQALQSGLAGEAEPLRRYGIFLSEAAVKAKATELGLTGVNNVLTDQEKVAARLGLILDKSGTAAGNFALTSGDLANQQRSLTAAWEDFNATLGEFIVPLASQVTGTLRGITDAADAVAGGLSDISGSSITGGELIAEFAGLINPASHVEKLVGSLSDAWGLLSGKQEKGADSTSEVKQSYEEASQALQGLSAALGTAAVSQDQLNKRQQDADSLRGSIMGLLDAEESHADALRGVTDANRSVTEAEQALADARQDQVDTLSDLNREVERNQRSVTAASRASTKAARDLQEANEDLATAQRDYAFAVADFGPNSRRAHEALEDLEDAQGRATDAQWNAEDAQYSLTEAARVLTESQNELNEAQRGGGGAADRVREAEDRLAEAHGRVVEAQDKVVDSSLDLLIEQEKVTAEIGESGDAAQVYVEWLDKMIAQHPELATTLGEQRDLFNQLADAIARTATEAAKLPDLPPSPEDLPWDAPSSGIERLFPVPGRARGGLVRAGHPYMTGEEGPELFVPNRSGLILSNQQTKGLAGAGSRVVNNNITVATEADPLHIAAAIDWYSGE